MTMNVRTPYAFTDWEAGKLPPEGWDCADAVADGWRKPELDALMRATVRPWSPAAPTEAEAEPEPLPASSPPPILPAPAGHAPTGPQADGGGAAGVASGPIFVVAGEVHRAVDQAIRVLSNPAIGLFSRGGELVRAVVHDVPTGMLAVAKAGENVRRPFGSITLSPITDIALVEVLTRHARFRRWDARASGFVDCNCPLEVARMILAGRGHGWTMPPLRAIISAPTLRHDGTVIGEPGYDAETGLLLVGERLWRHTPDSPSKRDALDALDVLGEPLTGFPFVDNADRTAALALLITSVLRPSLRTAPMFAVTAPAAGTGKSLLVDVAAILATGRKAAVVTPTPDEAELEKRIGAAALAGDQVLSIDNVTHILRSDQLCQMLTQDEVQVRVLGASKNVRIPSASLICATGNNLTVYGDLNRRTIRIRLDARCEQPDARQFDFDPTAVALEKRAELVAAGLTVVRAHLLAGTPDRAAPMGSFEDWSGTVRSALIWLGMGDCRGDVEALRADDPEKAELAEIIEVLPRRRFTVREVAAMVAGDDTMKDVLESFIGGGGVFSTKRFGKYLARYAGTIVGGKKIEKVSSDVHGAVWRVCGDDAERGEERTGEW